MSKNRLGIDGLVDDVLNDYARTRRTDNFSYSPRGGVAKANTGLTQYYDQNSETLQYYASINDEQKRRDSLLTAAQNAKKKPLSKTT